MSSRTSSFSSVSLSSRVNSGSEAILTEEFKFATGLSSEVKKRMNGVKIVRAQNESKFAGWCCLC